MRPSVFLAVLCLACQPAAANGLKDQSENAGESFFAEVVAWRPGQLEIKPGTIPSSEIEPLARALLEEVERRSWACGREESTIVFLHTQQSARGSTATLASVVCTEALYEHTSHSVFAVIDDGAEKAVWFLREKRETLAENPTKAIRWDGQTLLVQWEGLPDGDPSKPQEWWIESYQGDGGGRRASKRSPTPFFFDKKGRIWYTYEDRVWFSESFPGEEAVQSALAAPDLTGIPKNFRLGMLEQMSMMRKFLVVGDVALLLVLSPDFSRDYGSESMETRGQLLIVATSSQGQETHIVDVILPGGHHPINRLEPVWTADNEVRVRFHQQEDPALRIRVEGGIQAEAILGEAE